MCDVTPGKQTTATHILPYISRSKDNQTAKLGQLIDYNKKKIFLEKSYPKCGGNTSPKPFSKKSKLSLSLDLKFYTVHSLFILYTKLRAIGI